VAIRRVAAGGRYLDAGLAEQIAFAASGFGPHSQHDVLTDREQQVMRLLVRGLNVTRVAAALAISHKTVSTQKARLMEKRGGRQRGRYRPLCHSPPTVLAMLARDHIDRPYLARIAPTQKSASTDSCRIYITASFALQFP
jgi:DNA-binding NarL/FixJ family response regulator